jgi:ferrous iron transport protein B
MMDLLSRTRLVVDPARLSETLGVPVIPVDPRTGKGMADLIGALDQVEHRPKGPVPVNALAQLPLEPVAAFMEVRDLLRRSGAVAHSNEADSVTARIDGIVLHKYLGFPVFFLVLVSLFAAIFWAASPFMDLVDDGFKFAGSLLTSLAPQSVIVRFLAEGVIGGVGVVAVFFPQIMILFFLMTLLEDSGYLARGATLVDRPLSFLGLHGRSFVPMLSGFACAIPAVFAARSIPARRERLLTIWILPLMKQEFSLRWKAVDGDSKRQWWISNPRCLAHWTAFAMRVSERRWFQTPEQTMWKAGINRPCAHVSTPSFSPINWAYANPTRESTSTRWMR